MAVIFFCKMIQWFHQFLLIKTQAPKKEYKSIQQLSLIIQFNFPKLKSVICLALIHIGISMPDIFLLKFSNFEHKQTISID